MTRNNRENEQPAEGNGVRLSLPEVNGADGISLVSSEGYTERLPAHFMDVVWPVDDGPSLARKYRQLGRAATRQTSPTE